MPNQSVEKDLKKKQASLLRHNGKKSRAFFAAVN